MTIALLVVGVCLVVALLALGSHAYRLWLELRRLNAVIRDQAAAVAALAAATGRLAAALHTQAQVAIIQNKATQDLIAIYRSRPLWAAESGAQH